eukprot:CAMPEP_0180572128 /NCGR_PEP_ID=MMETSP1037_2-20121125/9088_1 /TAXON_ID=632150 /ORGANISM="Azadinium spinosum, Strain 3D9" /LENGTH=395 /DNA_ID=CAMNT_0022589493 /DNA_START=1 /DNA_END=1189 /DNA_ORIENTATION=+
MVQEDEEAQADGFFNMADFGKGTLADPLRHAMGFRAAQDEQKMRFWNSLPVFMQNTIWHGEKDAAIQRCRRGGSLEERLALGEELKAKGNDFLKGDRPDAKKAMDRYEHAAGMLRYIECTRPDWKNDDGSYKGIEDEHLRYVDLASGLPDADGDGEAAAMAEMAAACGVAVWHGDGTATSAAAVSTARRRRTVAVAAATAAAAEAELAEAEKEAARLREALRLAEERVEALRAKLPALRAEAEKEAEAEAVEAAEAAAAAKEAGEEADQGETEKVAAAARGLVVASYLNLALAAQRVEDHHSEALKLDPGNVKALFRRAQARIAPLASADEDWSAAAVDLRRAVELAPQDAAARQLLAKVRKEMQERRESARAQFGGLFSRGSLGDAGGPDAASA